MAKETGRAGHHLTTARPLAASWEYSRLQRAPPPLLGTTTGDVTTPFALSLGVGLSAAVGASEGFGLLMAASVLPIVVVLLLDMANKCRQRRHVCDPHAEVAASHELNVVAG